MWFKALESCKRIDTICTLLNMCLPFELRFLGTCLEELGRRDSQDLRSLDLRATDMIPCRKGEPIKVRRKMALYLALIRICNRTNVTEIFRSLESWGELDFSTMTDIDTLKELLLVYTMAANHPVFEFEQHLKFMKIFEKINENKLVADSPSTTASPPPQTQTSYQSSHLEQTLHMTQQQMQHVTAPSHQDFIQQHAIHAAAMHPSNQHHFTLDLLYNQFKCMVILRRSDVNWQPRLCDMTLLNFFLWDFLTSQVNVNKPQTTGALKTNITHVIDKIQPDLSKS